MFSIPVHILDFEGSRQSGIVEYGVATLIGREITATYSRLCAPTGTISDRDRVQHGITERATLGQKSFQAEWALFAGLRETGPFCAHNSAVEAGLIGEVWPYARTSPDFSDGVQMTASWGPWMDTLYLYRRIYPNLTSHKLRDLVEIFELQSALDRFGELYCPQGRRRYHCALYDALASALLLRRLYDEPTLAEMSLRWLILQSVPTDAGRESMGQQSLFQ